MAMIFKKLYESSTRNLFKESFSEDEFEKLFGFSNISETEALKRLIRHHIQALFPAFVNLSGENVGAVYRINKAVDNNLK